MIFSLITQVKIFKKIPDFSDLRGTLGDIYAFFVVTKENFVIRPVKMDMRNDKARHFR